MATRSHTETPRPYGEPAGLRLLAALESAGRDPFSAQEAGQEASSLGLSRSHVHNLLNELTAAGRVTRLKKGLYAVNDSLTRQPRAHPFAIGCALVTPSAISHWSALQHWGLTEQIPAAVTLSSPKRTFPPAAPREGGRRAWTVADTRYEVVSIAKSRFFGATNVWLDERNRVSIFDRERTILDAFQHFHIFGSISAGLRVLEEHHDELDLERLASYAVQMRVAAVVKRLGWALARLSGPADVLEPLRDYPLGGDVPLDPGRPPHGRHDPEWHIIENSGAR